MVWSVFVGNKWSAPQYSRLARVVQIEGDFRITFFSLVRSSQVMIASLQFCSFHRQADTLLCMIASIFHLEVLGHYGLSKIQPTTGAWSEWQRNVHEQSGSRNFNSTIDSIVKKAEIHRQVSAAERANDAKAKDAKSETKRTELFANEPMYGAKATVVWWSKTLSTEWEKSISCEAANLKFQKVEINYKYNHQHLSHRLGCDESMRENQDASRC